MMPRIILQLALACLLFCLPAAAANWDISGTWETQVMGSKVRANVQQQGPELAGVVTVYAPFGKKDRYTVRGAVRGNQVNMAHHSGHVFWGNLTPDGLLQGVLQTRDGHKVPIKATRR
jgi:hypothetical protein